MKKLKVRAYLQTGIVTNGYLFLDSILFSVLMREKYGAQDVTISGGRLKEDSDIELQFEKREKCGEWYYACSMGVWPEYTVDDNQFWTKRFDSKYSNLLDDKVKSVIINRGQFRAYHMPMFLKTSLYVDWFCVSNQEWLTKYLPMITHLGKKASQGFGRVLRWEVSEIDEDKSYIRPVPVKNGILFGIRPPYWQRKNQVECSIPSL